LSKPPEAPPTEAPPPENPPDDGFWSLRLYGERAELAACESHIEATLDGEKLLSSALFEDKDGPWRLDIMLAAEPGRAAMEAILRPFPGVLQVDFVPNRDWLALSRAARKPVRAGRYLVHSRDNKGDPQGAIAITIEAGPAFGTGGHFSTRGCLLALDAIAARRVDIESALDLGCGAGLLAIAIARTWPECRVVASDIDPQAVRTAAENGHNNGVEIITVEAPGCDHAIIAGAAPFDLVTANILAGPLCAMAAEVAAVLAPGGHLVLAGILRDQTEQVIAAYAAEGLTLAGQEDIEDWSCLRLSRR